jgi:hypothetical protein
MPISSSETPSSAAEDFGPYFFAWVDEGVAFDPYLHTRFDDDIFEFSIEQQEGDFASLSLTVQNPRVGLLAPGRQVWAWFSWWDGTQAVPLFYGRLVGLPENLQEETVTLTFIARPTDFQTQKDALAATLKVSPFWDPIFFDANSRDNADNVLESRPEAWHVDRITHDVTTSNIIEGEDGTLDFSTDDVFYDSVKLSYGTNPLRSVTVNASVAWEQSGAGTVNFPAGNGIQPNQVIQSYTGGGLFEDWPKQGSSIGGGWFWKVSTVTQSGMLDSSIIGEIVDDPNDPDPTFGARTIYLDNGFDTSLGTYLDLPDGTHIGFAYHVAIPNVTLTWSLQLGWEVNRRKTENLTFTLVADVQDIITLPDDGATLLLTMQSSEISNAVDEVNSSDGANGVPLRSALKRGYFNTPRGAQSIEYLIAVARAHLLARARCVYVTFEIPFETAVAQGVTLRKNAEFEDDRLPGGAAAGKIISYSLGLSDGLQTCSITIACSIGKNGTHDQITGTPDYVAEGYVDVGYQTYTGAYSLPFDETDVAYESQENVEPNDDGIDLEHLTGTVLQGLRVLEPNGEDETQEDALDRFTVTTDDQLHIHVTNTRYAQITFELPDLTNGPFETNYAVNVTTLRIPRTIDLEAESQGASS